MAQMLCTRFQAGGTTHALDGRTVNGKLVIVAGGSTSTKPEDAFYVRDAIQPKGDPGCGFFAAMTE